MGRNIHVVMKLDEATARVLTEHFEAAKLSPIFLRDREQLETHLAGVEWLLIGRPPRIDWSRAESLRLLHVAGSGVDPLFPTQGLASSVVVCNCPEVPAAAVRDHVLALLLALARDLPRAIDQQRRHLYRPYPSRPIAGQKVCVVGLGAIGRRVAEACAALGLEVTGVSAHARPTDHVQQVYSADQLQAAVAEADYTVLCLPLTSRSRGAFGRDVLAAMPASAALINVSRGGIVDELALAERLRQGALRAAAFDVFADEPLPPTSALWDCPRLMITPHNAGFTPDYVQEVARVFIRAIQSVERGERPEWQVSHAREY